jgi:heme-degrading monooxygenase HmoA
MLRERASRADGVVQTDPVYSILQVPVSAGGGDELLRRFAELGVFELAAEHAGLCAARLLRPSVPGEPFLVLAEWATAESYQAWLAHPARARVNEQLEPFLGGEPRGGLYAAVVSWPPSDSGEGRRA